MNVDHRTIKIALAGNPNSGKTTLFNRLTGSNQHIGNWPGVTVEKKEGHVKGDENIVIQDLPGIYSLSPYTLEEEISRTFLIKETPDVILNIVDGTNIERNLYLTTQLLDLGIPVVVALNMSDVVRRDGDQISVSGLEKALGCSVVEISALKDEGIEKCLDATMKAAKSGDKYVAAQHPIVFDDTVEQAIQSIGEKLQSKAPKMNRWYAVHAFERDEKAIEPLGLSDETQQFIENIISETEESLDDDSEGIITGERYTYIKDIVAKTVKKAKRKDNLTLSDRIDRVVTHRFWAYPIFILIITGVYYVAITLGLQTQDLVADAFFGEIVQANVETWLVGLGTSLAPKLNCRRYHRWCRCGLEFRSANAHSLPPPRNHGRRCYMAYRLYPRPPLRRFASGKSFIPAVGSGCSVPGSWLTYNRK